MARITIDDISRRTGLSRGTVSRAINARPGVSERTRERVLAECRTLNYVPNRSARSLATGRAYAVAVGVRELGTSYAADFLEGVLARAAQSQYVVQVFWIPDDAAGQEAALRGAIGERIDGLVLGLPLARPAAALLERADLPLVLSHPIEGLRADVIGPDPLESGRLAARHLLSDGATGGVLYVEDPTTPDAQRRWAGFAEVCAERVGYPAAIKLTLGNGERAGLPRGWGGEEALRRATRIAASDDATAIRVMMVCARLGRFAGADVAVVGQGNERLSGRIDPSLTSVDLCGSLVGSRAVEVLLARAEGARRDAPQFVGIAPRLVLRDSSRWLETGGGRADRPSGGAA